MRKDIEEMACFPSFSGVIWRYFFSFAGQSSRQRRRKELSVKGGDFGGLMTCFCCFGAERKRAELPNCYCSRPISNMCMTARDRRTRSLSVEFFFRHFFARFRIRSEIKIFLREPKKTKVGAKVQWLNPWLETR